MLKNARVAGSVFLVLTFLVSPFVCAQTFSMTSLKQYAFDGFGIGIPVSFQQRQTNTKMGTWLTPVVIFIGSVDRFGNENRIYVQGAGPFSIRVMDSVSTCKRYTESFVKNNPPHWTTELLEVKVDKYSAALNRCYFRYVTKREKFNLTYEHFVYLPPVEAVNPVQYDVFMYYHDGTPADEIAAMQESIRSFQTR